MNIDEEYEMLFPQGVKVIKYAMPVCNSTKSDAHNHIWKDGRLYKHERVF